MGAVNNIKKITKAMKMVASAKLRKSEELLNVARRYAAQFDDILPAKPEVIEDSKSQEAPKEAAGKKYLVLTIAADKGLCGSVNGVIIRNAKYKLQAIHKVTEDTNLMIFGEKAKAGLERGFVKDFVMTVGDYTKIKRQTFKQAAELTRYFLAEDWELGEIIFNRFKNLISFESCTLPLVPPSQQAEEAKLNEKYEMEGGSDLIENLLEFRYASLMYHLFAEEEATELSQRVNAMTNSSKNATEMLDDLKLQYNRGRQQQITTELIEIISGAAAAQAQKANA